MELLFASANSDKISEVQQILGNGFVIKGLREVGILESIPETGKTFHENAFFKSKYVFDKIGWNVFSDDSGLCINALNGAPGVFSARFAGEPKNDAKNIQMVLEKMKNVDDRSAYFICVVCLIWNGNVHYFEGRIDGRIAEYPSGNHGFGYDPIFIPNGFNNTFAELSPKIKNQLSHRYLAIKNMMNFLVENL